MNAAEYLIQEARLADRLAKLQKMTLREIVWYIISIEEKNEDLSDDVIRLQAELDQALLERGGVVDCDHS